MRADRRQRSFDFGPRGIPLCSCPIPDYVEMARFVRGVRANGRDALEQLRAMTEFALTDHERLTIVANVANVANGAPRPVTAADPITDQDLPF
jgi:hypothetical protein